LSIIQGVVAFIIQGVVAFIIQGVVAFIIQGVVAFIIQGITIYAFIQAGHVHSRPRFVGAGTCEGWSHNEE
jgi:hypothetical protein